MEDIAQIAAHVAGLRKMGWSQKEIAAHMQGGFTSDVIPRLRGKIVARTGGKIQSNWGRVHKGPVK